MDINRIYEYNELPTMTALLPDAFSKLVGISIENTATVVASVVNRLLERVVDGDVYKAPNSDVIIFVEKYPYSFIEKHMRKPQGKFSAIAVPQYVCAVSPSKLHNKLAVHLPPYLRKIFMDKINSGYIYPDMHMQTHYKNVIKYKKEREAEKRVKEWNTLEWQIL